MGNGYIQAVADMSLDLLLSGYMKRNAKYRNGHAKPTNTPPI